MGEEDAFEKQGERRETGKASINLELTPSRDPNLVTFDGPKDPDNPKNRSLSYKWTIVFFLSAMSFTTNLTVLVSAPAVPEMLEEFHSNNALGAVLIIAIWSLGATIGNLFIGPLSEIFGRRYVLNVANLFFLVFCIAGAQSNNLNTVIALRFLTGMSIATTSLNPTIVADLFIEEERGRAQSLQVLFPLMGPIVGPIIGGFLAQAKGWRWTFWLAAILVAAFGTPMLFLFRESYEATILRRRAKRLRIATGKLALYSQYDHNKDGGAFLRQTLIRPLKIFTMPIFLIIATSTSFIYGYIYLIVTTLSSVFQSNYGFSEGAAGLCFLGIAIGMASGALLCSFILDKYTTRMKARNSGIIKPEWRLPPLIVGYLIIPGGLFFYGWTLQAHVHYLAPIFATAFLGFGLYTITIPVTTYVADAFGTYRASALGALMMYRNACAALLPLAGPPLYKSLGLGWGNSVLGFIALAMLPILFLMLKFGETLRKRSRIHERL